jgi:DnaJ domain/ShK domain-like
MRSLFLLLLLLLHAVTAQKTPDLYKLLGLTKTASTKEIKQAYRRKALDTHPDKNKETDPEVAAEQFRQVVQAFEVLSDPQSRQWYDRTGQVSKDNGAQRGGFQQGGFQQRGNTFTFTWNFHQRVWRLKDKFEVQEAQSRVLHVVSLEQLQTIVLNEDNVLEKNVFMSFVVPGPIEQHVNDEMVFPYPFAGMSSQRIWWEDMLQTVQVRYHKSNELTEHFGVPTGDEYKRQNVPIFLFGRRGQPLDKMVRIQTASRHDLEMWVWTQLEVELVFVNRHDHEVEIYWLHGNTAHIKTTVPAGHSWTCTTMLSHEWYVRDTRVDSRPDAPNRNKLSSSSSLGTWKITSDESPQTITIRRRDCVDTSGHCAFWSAYNECAKNPGFMHDVCRKTCGVCSVEDDEERIRQEEEEEKRGAEMHNIDGIESESESKENGGDQANGETTAANESTGSDEL